MRKVYAHSLLVGDKFWDQGYLYEVDYVGPSEYGNFEVLVHCKGGDMLYLGSYEVVEVTN